MKTLGRIFARGLSAVLPAALTLGLLWWLGTKAEGTLGALLRLALPEKYYLPGFGILAGAGLIFLVGIFMHAWLARQLVRLAEHLLERVPLVKTVYGSFRDFASFFGQDEHEDKLGRPVLLEVNGSQLVGFVTSEDAGVLGLEDHLVVYLPMSYQLGGFTLVVPAQGVKPLRTLNTPDAMRYVLTAGLGKRPAQEGKKAPRSARKDG